MISFGANLFFEVHVIEDKDRDLIDEEAPELTEADKKAIRGTEIKFSLTFRTWVSS
jgi:hypothetical protein